MSFGGSVLFLCPRPHLSSPPPLALQIHCKHRTSQMLKLLLCAGLRGAIVAGSMVAIPAIAVAQHSMQDHAAPSGSAGTVPRDQVLAQASPQAPSQSAMPMMPGMGQGDMHAPLIITLRS